MATHKHNRPPPMVRTNAQIAKKKRDDKVALAGTYLAGQTQSPAGPALMPQATVLQGARDAVIQRIAQKKTLDAQRTTAETELLAAVQLLEEALSDYGRMAARESKGDPAVLLGLGVTPADPMVKGQHTIPDAPTKVAVLFGAVLGDALVKYRRPKGAGSFAIQYKIEPSAPTDPWVSSEALQTSFASGVIAGLPPGQAIRVRVRAIGAAPGPWSVEVLGRAR